MSRSKQIAGRIAVALNRMFGSRAGDRLGLLIHHRVQPTAFGLPDAPFSVTPEVFRQQLTGLLKDGYRFLKLSDALRAHHQGRSLPPRSVILTFDDVYESVYRHAFPVLRELGVPAVAFVATAFLDSSQPFPFDAWSLEHRDRIPAEDYRPLRFAQCHEMIESELIEMGAHTHTHQDFRGRPTDFYRDVERSVEIVRTAFRVADVPFAFPFGRRHLGYAGGAMTEAVRAAGACCALSTDCGLVDPGRDDPFSWGRFNCYQTDTAASIAAKLSGWFSWAPQLQVWLDQLRCRRGPQPIAPDDAFSGAHQSLNDALLQVGETTDPTITSSTLA